MVLMSTTNLVGFVLGTEGTRYLLSETMGTWRGGTSFLSFPSLLHRVYAVLIDTATTMTMANVGWAFIAIALPSLYANVHVMFEYR